MLIHIGTGSWKSTRSACNSTTSTTRARLALRKRNSKERQRLRRCMRHAGARSRLCSRTCTLPPKPGEATDGMPGFQMLDARQSPREHRVLEGMMNGRLPIRLVRKGTSSPSAVNSLADDSSLQASRYLSALFLLNKVSKARAAVTITFARLYL